MENSVSLIIRILESGLAQYTVAFRVGGSMRSPSECCCALILIVYRGEADGRYGGPTLSVGEWTTVLDRNSFNLDLTCSEFAENENNRMTGMIATKQIKPIIPDFLNTQTMLLEPSSCSDESEALANEVYRLLSYQGYRVERATWPVDAATCKGTRVVSLLELEYPFLATISEQDFSAFQQLILQVSGLIWVTTTGNPTLTMYNGLARSAQNERPETSFISLALSRKTASESRIAAGLVTKVALSHSGDTEFVEEGGLISVCRLEVDEELNSSAKASMLDVTAENISLGEAGRPLKLEIGSPGMLDTLCFGTDNSASIDLFDDEVEVLVMGSGIKEELPVNDMEQELTETVFETLWYA